MLFGACLIFVYFGAHLLRLRHKALVQEYRYRIYALRDELRSQLAERPDYAKHWVFRYLDSTMCRVISHLDTITFWQVAFLYRHYSDDPKITELRRLLEAQYAKVEHAKTKAVEEQFVLVLMAYMLQRSVLFSLMAHTTMYFSGIVRFFGKAQLVTYLREKYIHFRNWQKRQFIELVLVTPESSTLSRFAPSAT